MKTNKTRSNKTQKAAWRLFGMHIHEEMTKIGCLAIHLSEIHQVLDDSNDQAATILEHAKRQKTILTLFFEIYGAIAVARQYIYIPIISTIFYLA